MNTKSLRAFFDNPCEPTQKIRKIPLLTATCPKCNLINMQLTKMHALVKLPVRFDSSIYKLCFALYAYISYVGLKLCPSSKKRNNQMVGRLRGGGCRRGLHRVVVGTGQLRPGQEHITHTLRLIIGYLSADKRKQPQQLSAGRAAGRTPRHGRARRGGWARGRSVRGETTTRQPRES